MLSFQTEQIFMLSFQIEQIIKLSLFYKLFLRELNFSRSLIAMKRDLKLLNPLLRKRIQFFAKNLYFD